MKRVFYVFLVSICIMIAAQCAYALEFTDCLGRTVEVEQSAVAACVPGYLAEAWLESGGTLCAVSEDAISERGIEFDGIVAGSAHEPNLELIVESDPDIVILASSQSSYLDLEESLTSMGIACAYFDVNTYGEYLDMMDIFRQINGTQSDRSMEQEIQAIISESDVGGAEMLLLRAFSTGVKAKDSTGVAGAILADMGFKNIADGGALEEVTLEAIVDADPDYIFIVSMGADEQAAMDMVATNFSDNPAWAGLSAVKNDRVYLLPRELFHLKPNEKWVQSYEYIHELLGAQ